MKKPIATIRTGVNTMARMKLPMTGLLLLSLTTLVYAQETAVPAARESDYYPLKKDTVWTFKAPGGSVQMKVTGKEKIGTEDASKIETIVNGKSVATEHVVVREDGIYRVSINGQKPETPVKFFALPPGKETSWEIKTKIQNQDVKGKFVAKEEDVTVPLGKYKARLVEGTDFEIAGMKTTVKYWFAEKVGIVKLSFSIGGQDAVLELEKYEPAK